MSNKVLIHIVGPTAVGKTALAISLAQYFQTEIISSDSRQFYKEISIGTAKPTNEELAAVNHHFINTISVTQRYSAGDFERDALAKLDELFQHHDVVIAVGGSGLYVKALHEGLDTLPEGNEQLRKELHQLYQQSGIEALHHRLKNLNTVTVKETEMMNPQRLMRAIEIAEAGVGSPQKQSTTRNFKTIQIGLNMPREKLYAQINHRVEQMIANGLVDEVKHMLPYKDTYALQTVGYKEVFDYFDGIISLEKAIDLIKQHTRNYAKRQLTWFKRDQSVKWFEPHEEEAILTYIKSVS